MNILDIIILVCMVPAIIQGLRKGFINQAISIISLIAGVWLSANFADVVATWLSGFLTASEQAIKIMSFVIILAGVMIGLSLIGKLLNTIIQFIMLGWLNKLLGAAFSIIKCILILGVVAMIFEGVNNTLNIVSAEYIEQSSLYGVVKSAANIIFPYIKSLLNIQ